MTTTSISTVREAVYERFDTQWANLTPFCFDNEKFTPAADTNWVRVAVRHLTSAQESMGAFGNRRFLRTASIFVQVFTKLDSGVAAADALVQKVRDIFEGVTFPGLDAWTNAVAVREIGPLEGYHQTNVEASLTYLEIR